MKRKNEIMFVGIVASVLILMAGPAFAGSCWSVDKTADVGSEVTLPIGEELWVNYTITVDAVGCLPEEPEVLNVADLTYGEFLGTVDRIHETLPKSFNYSKKIGPYELCGDFTVKNVAYICVGKTDTHTLLVRVPCPGCTYTLGYWKTHSVYGPAPYEEAWGGMEDIPFYKSGKTMLGVLQTPPKGRVYYILAHQYITSRLNFFNGAGYTPEVLKAWIFAYNEIFLKYAPNEVPDNLVNKATRYAELLDQYNNGVFGPGHCEEIVAY
jgi:hypothetical protein